MPRPTVDIIIPCFDAAAFVLDALDSIAEQTYPLDAVHVIAIDDGSTDSTLRILQDFAGGAPFRMTVLGNERNAGANVSRNRGLLAGSAEFVYFMDADSLLRNEAIERLVSALEENPDPSVAYAYSDFTRLWLDSASIDDGFRPEAVTVGPFHFDRLWQRNYISMMSLVRRSALPTPAFDESITRFQDWDLWLELAERGRCGTYLPECLFYAYVRTDGISGDAESIERLRSVVAEKYSIRRAQRCEAAATGALRVPADAPTQGALPPRITNEPRSISVVLGVYGQARLLERTLPVWAASCIHYPFGSELIICDDGSPDDTAAVVERARRSCEADRLRVRYLRQDNAGHARLARNLNQCLPHLAGEYTLFAMGDSYPRGELLSEYAPFVEPYRILSGLRENVRALFDYREIVPDHRKFHDNYLNIDRTPRPWEGFTGNNFVIPTAMLRRIGGWNEEFEGYGAEDWELALYACYHENVEFLAIPEAVVYHVTHDRREGAGDPDWHLAKWVRQLHMRYASGDLDRSTNGLFPRPESVSDGGVTHEPME